MSGPASHGTIDAYLDDLFLRLPRRPARMRQVLAEAEDHLRESAARLVAEGWERQAAEHEAVLRFGDVDDFADAVTPRAPLGLVALGLLRVGVSLAGVALVAIGASGVVAAGMNAFAGPHLVGGSSASGSAVVSETADDAVSLRLLAGLLGVVVLVVAGLLRRRWPSQVLPAVFSPTVAVCGFGGATVALLAAAGGAVPVGVQPAGAGFFLSGAAASAVAVVAYAGVLLQQLRRPAPGAVG